MPVPALKQQNLNMRNKNGSNCAYEQEIFKILKGLLRKQKETTMWRLKKWKFRNTKEINIQKIANLDEIQT